MYRSSATPPPSDNSPEVDWTLALAGGDGMRLADYVERRFGQRMPKQYCALLGRRSMLQHTLDRMNKITPAARSLTVIGTHHGSLAMPQLAGICDHVFRQPASRDTGMALYVALAMIKRWTPNAVVTMTPTDHYVAPSARYVAQVRAARDLAAQLRDRVVILGATPSEPDPELGYLALGDALSEVPSVHAVRGFVEKPTVAAASQLIRGGALWNTMVTCGTVDALWELGREAEPQLLDILDSLVPLIGTPDEDDAIDYIYRAYLPVSFSRDMLERAGTCARSPAEGRGGSIERAPGRLAAMEMTGVEWSDWGKPERIESVLALRRSRALVSGLAL